MSINNMFFIRLAAYMIFWICLSENFDFQTVVIGMFITTIICLYNKGEKGKCIGGKRYLDYKTYKFYISYLILLIKEIIIASIYVAKIVLSPKLNISPSVIKFKTRLKGDLSKAILANSITLTPGTLTIEVKDNEFTVHCISENQINDVKNSKFEQLLLIIEEQLQW